MVDKNRIFLLKKGGVKECCNLNSDAVWDSFDKTIAVDDVRSTALLACHVAHEGFHATSYHSQQINKDGYDLSYRSGIKMIGRNNEGNYFSIAQEAIIATLSQDFFNEVICKDSLYKKEIRKTNEIKEWLIDFTKRERGLDENTRVKRLNFIKDIRLLPGIKNTYSKILDSGKDEDYRFGYFAGYFSEQFNNIIHERSEEREKFDSVLDRLIDESNGKLGNKKELFNKFAKVHFTGNYLPLAKEIDLILGKGSFRKLAIELGDVHK